MQEPRFSLFIIWINTCSLITSFAAVNCATIPAVELDALLQFKLNYIAKGSQHLLASWNPLGNASTVCESWVGINCTNSTTASGYHIQSINLRSLDLQGSIAPHLGNLTFLSILDLSQNAFTGSIPLQLMGCISLKLLNLDGNMLISPIPPLLTSLPLLEIFWLCNNSFRGPIPSTLLTNITTSLLELGLCNNAFSGSIPADLGVLHASKLQYLALWENNLSGAIPPSLGNFSNLRLLEIDSNKFLGPIPAELGMLQNLQKLYLFSNDLTGAIPGSLCNCTNLIHLELSWNELTGSIPAQLGLLGNLTVLFLGNNSFTGVIPSSIGNCTSVVTLNLSYNQLSGTIPASMSMLGQLEGLGLYGNHLSGALQHLDFSNLTKLTAMSLSSNQLGGPLILPINFSKLQQIQGLDISNNQFTGEIPWDALVNCTSLYTLDLSNNKLSGAIPSILGRFQWLRFLNLQGNLLWGAFPEFSEFNNQLNLLQLSLSSNHLNGSLPSSLPPALLTLAGSLDLSHNDFSGPLPPWLGQLDKVLVVDLSRNNFVGSIPVSLGDCVALVSLSLSNNHLSGDLPPQLQNLAYLQLLDLSNNNLSGVLPSFLGSTLLHLQILNVSFNNFTGPIPTNEGVFKHLTASSFQGNPHLCGTLLNKTCITDVEVLPKQHHQKYSLLQLKNWKGILLITFLSALVLIGLVLLLVITQRCCFSHPVDVPSNTLAHEAKRYTAKELIEATQGYSELNLLGEGGVGVVYKGVLSDGQVVAIKKLKDIDNGSEEALLKEMHILGKLRHRNLVKILGCVINLDIKVLILQYMENGSLEQYLNMHIQSQHMDQEPDQKKSSSLRYWLMVNRVATGIAHALAYLDHGYGQSIIHGDVKPDNILLDSDFEPCLADFGLAKLIQRGAEATSLSSNLKGSIGYMAPEYAYAARVTTKVDVYSFGVVVLRMVTGKSPTEVVPEGTSLHEWVKSKLASAEREGADSVSSWQELLDAALVLSRMPINNVNASDHEQRGNVDKESVRHLLRMGLACTSHHPQDRPTIHQVLAYLTSQNTALLTGS